MNIVDALITAAFGEDEPPEPIDVPFYPKPPAPLPPDTVSKSE
jgi:hypothetical protein